jgi:hypothetical protein
LSLGSKQGFERGSRHRLGVQVAPTVLAAKLAQSPLLVLIHDAFGNHIQMKILGEIDDGLDDCSIFTFAAKIAREA